MKLVIFGTILQKRNVDKIAFILVDQNFPSLPQSIAAYQLVQSFLLYKVCSSPVRVSQLPENQALADLKNGSESTGALSDKLSSLLELHEEDRQRSSTENHPFLSRVSRSLNPCEEKRVRKWNHCLERYIIEVHCKKHSVGCYSPGNIPPKCKKNFKVVFGPSGSCTMASNCTCAAWRNFCNHCTGPFLSSPIVTIDYVIYVVVIDISYADLPFERIK